MKIIMKVRFEIEQGIEREWHHAPEIQGKYDLIYDMITWQRRKIKSVLNKHKHLIEEKINIITLSHQ